MVDTSGLMDPTSAFVHLRTHGYYIGTSYSTCPNQHSPQHLLDYPPPPTISIPQFLSRSVVASIHCQTYILVIPDDSSSFSHTPDPCFRPYSSSSSSFPPLQTDYHSPSSAPVEIEGEPSTGLLALMLPHCPSSESSLQLTFPS